MKNRLKTLLLLGALSGVLIALGGALGGGFLHVRNRDVLVSSIAATLAAAVTWLAHLAERVGRLRAMALGHAHG